MVAAVGGAIRDDAARRFAIAFYGGLEDGESVATAYRLGCAAIHLEGLPVGDRPQLKVRDGIDAHKLVLARRFDRSPTTGELRDVDIADDSTGLLDATRSSFSSLVNPM